MKSIITLSATFILAFAILQACGPSEEELRQQELQRQQAVQDSLQQVWDAEMEQILQDSLEQARLDSLSELEEMAAEEEEEVEATPQPISIEYSQDGPLTVQVRSWRSEEHARAQAERWKDRGFPDAYVVKYGNEDSGDVWFRVRVGNVDTRSMARQLQEKLLNEYNTESWIDNN
ncbi:MAG: SPOR domain-containing protein [Balneolaceae bacterium]